MLALLVSCHWIAVVDSRRPIPKAPNHVSNDELKQEIKRVLADNIQMHPTEIHAEITRSRAERLAGAPEKHHHVTLKQVQKLVPRMRHEAMRERMELQIDATGNVVAVSDGPPSPPKTVNSSAAQQPRIHSKKKKRQARGDDDGHGASSSMQPLSQTQSNPKTSASSTRQEVHSEDTLSDRRSPARATAQLSDPQPTRLLQSASANTTSVSAEQSQTSNGRGGSELEEITRSEPNSDPVVIGSRPPPLPHDDHHAPPRNVFTEPDSGHVVLNSAHQQLEVNGAETLELDGVDATGKVPDGVDPSNQHANRQIDAPPPGIQVSQKKEIRASDHEHNAMVQSADEETDPTKEKETHDDDNNETDEKAVDDEKSDRPGSSEPATNSDEDNSEVVNVNEDAKKLSELGAADPGKVSGRDDAGKFKILQNSSLAENPKEQFDTPVLDDGRALAPMEGSNENASSTDAQTATMNSHGLAVHAVEDQNDRQAEYRPSTTIASPDSHEGGVSSPEPPRNAGESELLMQGDNNVPDYSNRFDPIEEASEASIVLESRQAVDRELDRLKREHDALSQLDGIDAELARLKQQHASLEDKNHHNNVEPKGIAVKEQDAGERLGKQEPVKTRAEGTEDDGEEGLAIIEQGLNLEEQLEVILPAEGQVQEPSSEQQPTREHEQVLEVAGDDEEDLQRGSLPPPPPPPPPQLDQNLIGLQDEASNARKGDTESDITAAAVDRLDENPAPPPPQLDQNLIGLQDEESNARKGDTESDVTDAAGDRLDENPAPPPPNFGIDREEEHSDHVDKSIGSVAFAPPLAVKVDDEFIDSENNGEARDMGVQSRFTDAKDEGVNASAVNTNAGDSVRISRQQERICCTVMVFFLT